jgi:hypothetical protein
MNKENITKLMEKYSFLRVAEDPFIRRGNESMLWDLMAFGIEVNDGWYSLIDGLCASIIKILEENNYTSSDIKTDQVKEKFGSLRFYYHFNKQVPDSVEKAISDLVETAERLSSEICETCGNHGKTYNDTGWLTTECESCRWERLRKHNL